MMVARTVIHHLLVALPVVCLFAATLTTAFNQNDEDLIFDDEGVVRARREVEVAPVAEPLQDSSNIHSHSGRQRRQLFSNPFGSTSDDEDDEGSAIEGSGMEPRVYRVMFTLEKRWTQAYRNREGPAYRNTKAQISSAFTELLQDVQGNPNLQVVAMTKSPSSEIRLTVDITYDWEPERSNEIKMKIENALRSGFVGSHRVRKQRFSIDEHKALPVPRPRCGPGQHQCLSGRCVARCDGKNECLDASDEKGCPPKLTTAAPPPIPSCRSDDQGPRQCNDGVSYACYCDGHEECPGREDEDPQTCGTSGCEPSELLCDFGTRCVQSSQLCDGTRQCLDGLDEQDCTPTPVVCPSDQFACNDGTCIEGFRHCDFAVDCRYGEDETSCAGQMCPQGKFMCDDGNCIETAYRCDGTNQCLDQSDESGCPTACRPDEMRCDDGQCLVLSRRCNGIEECTRGEDERGCPCQPDEWRCPNGQCIPAAYRCDGHQDCSDGSDEDCGTVPPTPASRCSSNQFQCSNGNCVSQAFRCDGFPDCSDGSDESDAECPPETTSCSSNQFACSSGECVGLDKRCDRKNDCYDNSDERGCLPFPDRVDCRENEFKCANGLCIEKAWRCDTVPDCDDGSDEEKCISCRPTEFECGDGSCIPEYNRCDGRYDCTDGSDERVNCADCGQNEFQCGNGDCIPFTQRCNGYAECRDRSDEQNCRECQSYEFKCLDGQCISLNVHCDGRVDCRDGSDEAGCNEETTTQRSDFENYNSFWCSDGVRIDSSLVCNGNKDCSDGSDEAECNYGTDYLSLKTYPDNQNIQQSKSPYFGTDPYTLSSPIPIPSSEVPILISVSPYRFPLTALLAVVLAFLLPTH